MALSSFPTEDPHVSLPCGVWLWGSSGAGVGARGKQTKTTARQRDPAGCGVCEGSEILALNSCLDKAEVPCSQVCAPPCSHEPLEWAEAPRETHPYHAVQAPDSAAAP